MYMTQLILWRDPSDLIVLVENTADRSRYKFGGKLVLFMPFGTFFMTKAKQGKIKYLS